MVAMETPKAEIGWQAPDFSLPGTDGKTYSLSDAKGEKGLVVMFICNHCPFVQAITDKLVQDFKALKEAGVNAIAISANDVENYPQDSPENMKKLSEQLGFPFPYVYDETQEVAKAYGAVCTPDFFGFDADLKLQYRGRLDDSAMERKQGNARELVEAMRQVAENGQALAEQNPSVGCSIKWKQAA